MTQTADPAVVEAFDAALDAAGVDAFIHARDLATGTEIGRHPDTPVVLASVFKIPIALELARRFESGRLQPEQRIRVGTDRHTVGETGVSGFLDEVDISLRDLAQQMITVSDNTATDVVLELVGREAVNDNIARLGLTQTFIEGDCKFLLTRLVDDLNLAPDELAHIDEPGYLTAIPMDRWSACREIDAPRTNRSTAREMTRLLELIWTDQAATAEACAFVRRIMGQQIWPHRLRAGFPGGVKTSGKTGTLPFVRNEVGVVEYPDGGRYAVAVFTVARDAELGAPERDRVIGTVARIAVDYLRNLD